MSLAVISPNDPDAMAKYATECRELHIPYVYDPSQQVARLSGDDLLDGLEGAAILIANEYEFGVIEKKTGLSEAEMLAHVPVLIVTRGAEGSTIALRGGQPEAPDGAVTFRIPPARLRGPAVDPTGVGRRVPRRAPRGPPARPAVGGRRAGSGAWPPSTRSRPSVRSRRATRSRTSSPATARTSAPRDLTRASGDAPAPLRLIHSPVP